MTTGLVSAGVHAEVEHERLVLGSVDVGTAEGVGHVVAEESGLGGLEDGDTVGGQLEGINSLGDDGVHQTLNRLLNRRGLVLGRGGVEGDGVVNHDINVGLGSHVEDLVRQQGKTVPVAVLVSVGSGNVRGGAEADEHGLNGPLELREQDVVSRDRHTLALEAVDADEREADALNIVGTLFCFVQSISLREISDETGTSEHFLSNV